MASGLVAIIFRGNDQLTKVTNKIGNSFKNAGKQTKKFGKGAASSFGIPITPATALLAAVGGLAIAFRSVVKEGSAFTATMSNVKAVSRANEEQMESLTATAKQLGATTAFTAKEAAEGMTFLAMAGFEAEEIVSTLPGVLNLAAAASTDLGTSADIVSNVLSGFGANVDQTGRFVDVLTNTFTTSNTSLVQLGEGMKFVAPVAADLGISIEQTAATMGILGNAGIQASSAGTNLRSILLRLAAPTGAIKTELDRLNISIFDSQGAMLPFEQVIGNVNEALVGMTEEQRAATLETLAGKRNISAFSVILKEGEEGLANYTKQLKAQGTAAEVATVQLDNLAGDQKLLNSAVSAFKIDTFEKLDPILRDLTQGMTELVQNMGKGTVTAEVWGLSVDGVAVAFDGVEKPVKSVVRELNEIERAMLPIGPLVIKTTKAMEAQNLALSNQFVIAGKLVDLDAQRLTAQQNIARAMVDDAEGMDIAAGTIAQFAEIKDAQVASQQEAAEASKQAWNDRFSEVSSVVASVLGEGISTIQGLNIDFGEDVGRQVGENARRLAIIASKGFIDETDTSIQALAAEKPEIFQQLLESEDPGGLAKQMLADFQLGIGAGKLINKSEAIKRVRRILFGQQQLAQLTNEIAQELVSEGAFAAEDINAALNQALGKTADIGQGQFAPALTETAGTVTTLSDTITSALLPSLNDLLIPAFNELVLGMTGFNEFLVSTLIPTLNDLLILSLNELLLVSTTFNDYLVNTLIVTLTDSFLPALTDLWTSIVEEGKPGIEDLTTVSEDLWASINDTGIPSLQELTNLISTQFTPSVLISVKSIILFTKSIQRATSTVKKLIAMIKELKKELASLNPPSWMQGQSPPPMANWLSDIADQANRANESILGLRSGLRLSNNPAAGGTNTGGATTNNTNNTFNLNVNSNSPTEPILQDFQSMQARIASV